MKNKICNINMVDKDESKIKQHSKYNSEKAISYYNKRKCDEEFLKYRREYYRKYYKD